MPDTPPATTTLDVTGLRCPVPVIRAGRALRSLAPGDVLEIIATDPLAELDLRHFCAEAGHEVLTVVAAADQWVFTVRRGAGAGPD